MKRKPELVMLANGGAYIHGHMSPHEFACLILTAEGAYGCSATELQLRISRIEKETRHALCRI